MSSFRVISADSHVVEPGDLWTEGIARSYLDRAPRIVRDSEGADTFQCDGMVMFAPSAMSQAGKPAGAAGKTWEDVYPGAYDPDARLKDMARDGVEAEVLYPSVAMSLYALEDIRLKAACFEAYNSWIAQFCSAYADRFKGIAMIAIEETETAVAELTRTRRLGLPGAMVTLATNDPSFRPRAGAALRRPEGPNLRQDPLRDTGGPGAPPCDRAQAHPGRQLLDHHQEGRLTALRMLPGWHWMP